MPGTVVSGRGCPTFGEPCCRTDDLGPVTPGRAGELLGAVPPSVPRSDATLGEWLSAHAREVSTRRLALDVGGGALAAFVVALWRPTGWPALLGAALCFVAFGAWAVAERRLTAPRPPAALPPSVEPPPDWSPAWHAVRAAAALVGTLAAALAVFGFFFGVLGTWIS